jgi:hypothetical protein
MKVEMTRNKGRDDDGNVGRDGKGEKGRDDRKMNFDISNISKSRRGMEEALSNEK